MNEDMIARDTAPLQACAVSRDIQRYDLLVDEMENVFGSSWGELTFAEISTYLQQSDSVGLQYITLAIDSHDENSLPALIDMITQIKARGIKVILVTHNVTPTTLHFLVRAGADSFIPYALLPKGELRELIANREVQEHTHLTEKAASPSLPTADQETLQVNDPEPQSVEDSTQKILTLATPKDTIEKEEAKNSAASYLQPISPKDGAIIVTHGVSGGTGATTLAVNLAWEICTAVSINPPKVCLIDLNLQFGAIATYLDLQANDFVGEALSEAANLDDNMFMQAVSTYNDALSVFTAPGEMMPLEFLTQQDVARIIELAQRQFDYVIIDMPTTLTEWTETVLNMAHVYFVTSDLDMRSAQNALRFKQTLMSESLPVEKLRFAINRAPKLTDLSGKSRIKRMSESLGISIDLQLPDGGKAVTQAGDQGQVLALSAPKNPLRKEVSKLADSILKLKAHKANAA